MANILQNNGIPNNTATEIEQAILSDMAGQPPPTEQQEQFAELKKHLFRSDEEIEKPNPVIAYNGCIISTKGNVTTIAGQSKSGKTGVTGGVLAGCLDNEADTIGLHVVNNTNSKGVIHIDTEQSSYDHHRLNKQILSRAGIKTEPNWYYSFHLRHLMPNELKQATEIILEEVSKKHDGLHLVVIDGIAEYVVSPNDDKESNAVVHFFTNLADRYHIPIILILHYNPGSEKGRGHLGSQLERKSESYLSITKHTSDKSVSLIQAVLMRNGSVDDFGIIEFTYNKDKGYHTYLQSATKEQAKERALKERQEEKKWELGEYVSEIFDGVSKLRYSDIATKLIQISSISTPTAKRRIKEMTVLNLIYRSEVDDHYYRSNS